MAEKRKATGEGPASQGDHTKSPLSIMVQFAALENIARIRRELFPKLVGGLEYDKRYFQFIGSEDVKYITAEIDGELIHYSWLFLDARRSPLMQVPFHKEQFRPGDVFIGPVFTVPAARGLWVYPYVLSFIVRYLRKNRLWKSVLIFVDGRKKAACPFYKRLGFDEINTKPRGLVHYVTRVFGNSWDRSVRK